MLYTVLQIPTLTPTDCLACQNLDLNYVTEYVWHMHSTERDRMMQMRFDTVRLPRQMAVNYPRPLAELTTHAQQGHYQAVAKLSDGQVIGVLDAMVQIEQRRLWVCHWGVTRMYRRKGHGRRLLQQALNWAAQQGLRRAILELQTKNHPAITFAQQHGFQFCGYSEHYYNNEDIALFFSHAL